MTSHLIDRCAHGIPFSTNTCEQCEKVWAEQVQLPQARATIARLLQFYQKETLIELVFAQEHHVTKLQDKLHRLAPSVPALQRHREG